MEQATTYKFSKGIQRTRKRYTTLAIMLPVVLIASLFLSPISEDLSPTAIIGIGFFSFVSLGVIFYFTASRVLRKLSELSVYIFPNKLERVSPETKEEFFWKDLLHVEILEYPNSEIVSIKLTFANKKIITLFGFENMEIATNQITQYISDKDMILRKRAKVNWDNPVIMILSGILPLVIILAIQEVGKEASQFFIAVVFLAIGLYNLIAKPISRAQGKGWEKFETITSIVLVICSILLLTLELFIVLIK